MGTNFNATTLQTQKNIRYYVVHDAESFYALLGSKWILNHTKINLSSYLDEVVKPKIEIPILDVMIQFSSTIESLPQKVHCSFLVSLINTIIGNLIRTKNNLRYSTHVNQFALALFIYAGRNAYRLMSMNIPVLLPSITTIRKTLKNLLFP